MSKTPHVEIKSLEEYNEELRQRRLLGTNKGGIDTHVVANVQAFKPKTHDRTSPAKVSKLDSRLYLKDVAVSTTKVKSKIASNESYMGAYKGITGLIMPEYDLLEPFSIYDTEVYVKQATSRRLSLMFRNGWDIISDIDHNVKNVKYIKNRLSTLEYVMNMPTQTFFTKILFDLLITSNCFLLKIRDAAASAGVANNNNGNRVPVAGYAFVPSNQILPFFELGKLKFWRRYYESGIPYEDFQPEDVIHLKWDVKNGHFYGTPRLVGVVDDIFALRRLEENIELLFINYLFPLFHVTVGNEKAPCTYGPNGESEIDLIRSSIENMPKEGVFVSDERVAVNTVGAEGSALDTTNLIAHLKARVLSGLGVSGIDVGETDTATRTTADNVSQNLKDQIKADLTTFCDLIRIHFFKEWFQEANYSLSIQDAVSKTHIRFNEVDVDNKIKMENHYIQLWLNDGFTSDEFRRAINKAPLTKQEQNLTHSAIVFAREKELAEMQVDAQSAMTAMKVGAKGAANLSANKARPANQHGRNPGPTKAKSSRSEFYKMSVDAISKLQESFPDKDWREVSDMFIADAQDGNLNFSDNVDYTKEPRKDAYLSELIKLLSLVDNTEMLSIVVEDNLRIIEGTDNEQLSRQESQSDNSDESAIETGTAGSQDPNSDDK